MLQTVKISSKGQITLPIAIVKSLGLKRGDRLVVESKEGGTILMHQALTILNEISGSIPLPHRFRNKSLTEIRNIATYEYFKKKHK
ncbi:hypothetical protein COU89_02700 [Candidatus Roizmanbacteria bacterium CG10_big_fil_rev_8_21_14_0_10_45_7]|uniref:SpoVT-AbrB domain-containing protein n=1 Tax=Candidatus Roizmanbacteria bacterium CG10_big_fil_rev_8_21_14_0_10_45_7 TaxID=1974854 RepID=A0A2M8KUL2_9BACT|nr:MAG: hypothetical protein COU89_02700 [Candidatus Roizmanbacteria bacterium CG10_big_fil_rev_8_21_14_0_10_45_7]